MRFFPFLPLLGVTCLCAAPSALKAESKTPPRKAILTTSTLKIDGMHCQGCASGITNQLKKLEGVKTVSISAARKEGTVQYDPSRLKPADLVARVKKAGFTASVKK